MSGSEIGERVARLEADNDTQKQELRDIWTSIGKEQKRTGALERFQSRIATGIAILGFFGGLIVAYVKSLFPHP